MFSLFYFCVRQKCAGKEEGGGGQTHDRDWEQRAGDCESLIMVNTSSTSGSLIQAFSLTADDSLVIDKPLEKTKGIVLFIHDYHFHRTRFFFHRTDYNRCNNLLVCVSMRKIVFFLFSFLQRGHRSGSTTGDSGFSILLKDTTALQCRCFFFWHLDCLSKKKTIQPIRHTLLYVTAMAFPERSPTLCSHWLHHIPSWNRLTLHSSHFRKLWMSFPREPAFSLYSGFKDSFCLTGPRIFFGQCFGVVETDCQRPCWYNFSLWNYFP